MPLCVLRNSGCGRRSVPFRADAIRAAPGRRRQLRSEMQDLDFGDRHDPRRDRARLRSLRGEEQCPRRHHRVQFGRRLGAWRDRARPRHPQARHDDDGRPHHRRPGGAEADSRNRQPVAARRLRIDVRLRAARGRAPRGAERGAGAGASDLARRPPRRCRRGDLFGRRPGAGPARYRQARAIHHRDGRHRRTAGSVAAHSALGADARAQPRRIAADESRQFGCRRRAPGESGSGDHRGAVVASGQAHRHDRRSATARRSAAGWWRSAPAIRR